jgi:hypothetical protein
LTVQDTFNTYHTYEIDWTPDTLTWKIDDQEMRTVDRKSTWNSTSNRFDYPQTPARVQLSLWPAGLPSNAEGTIAWAGGEISWDAPDVKNAGYYYARIQEVTVKCYDPPKDAKGSGSKAYIYDGQTGYENTVEMTNNNTILGSFDASGLDPDKGKQQSSKSGSSKTASATGSAETSEKPQIPGMSGQTGNGGVQGGSGGGDSATGNSGGGSGSGSDGGGSGTGSNDPQPSTFHGWSQGDDNQAASAKSGGTGAAASVKPERFLQGSMLAVLFAIAGVIVL